MKAHLQALLICTAFFVLSSCQQIEPQAEPTVPAPFHIFLSAQSSYWQQAISDCTRDLPQLSVLIEQEPQDLVQPGPEDWVIQSGEPAYQTAFPLGTDDLVIIINPANPVNAIDLTQLRGIYTGFLTTWGAVDSGISDDWIKQDIQPVHYLAHEPITSIFEDTVLSGEALSPRVWLAPGSAEMFDEVTQNKYAIGWVPSRWLTSTVKAVPQTLAKNIPLTVSMQKEPDEYHKILIGCLQSKAR